MDDTDRSCSDDGDDSNGQQREAGSVVPPSTAGFVDEYGCGSNRRSAAFRSGQLSVDVGLMLR